jgi:phosphate transport system permease protein
MHAKVRASQIPSVRPTRSTRVGHLNKTDKPGDRVKSSRAGSISGSRRVSEFRTARSGSITGDIGVADMAVQSDVSDVMEAAGPYDRARALSAFKLGDAAFYWITRACAILVLLILGGIILSLIAGAWPAIRAFGFSFLLTARWAPSADPPVLGALGPIYGTLVTSVIAMIIAIPVGLGIAIFLTELCPQWLRRPIGIAIELLAGIPSIIYGMWGFFVLGPFLAYTFQPFMIGLFDGVPVLGTIFGGPPSYLSLFNAALILAIMVLPFITAISVDVFKTVPPVLKEAAYGVGCTTWEVVRKVVIPYTRVGVIGGIMLALGRALGETMAVTFIIGNAFRISGSIFAPGTTISAAIASEFAESDGLHQSGLILLGLLLFVMTFFVLAAARLMLMRLEKKAGN